MSTRRTDRWDNTTFGRLAQVRNGADYSSVEVQEGGYPVYGSGGEFRRASRFLFDGESVLFGRKGTVDRPLYVDGKFWTVDTMFYSVIDRSRLLPRFAYYWATTLPFKAWATDTALPSMTSTAIKAAPIALPSVPEQRAIADYLDRETAQIDAFIAKTAELIALLTERRAAVIARSTTRGVRPAVKLVGSGLPWVGEVPSHWSVQPTRTVLRVAKSTVGAAWSDTTLLSLTKRGVIVRDIESGEGKFPASFEGYQLVNPGDMVFCLFDVDETPRTVGLVHDRGMVTGAYARFQVNSEIADARFLEFYYTAIDDEKRFRPLYTGLRKVIKKDRFLSAGIALPPLAEQREIVAVIAEKLDQLDGALTVAERGVELARERRAALISAAVTGKIDVRVAA